MDNKKTWEEMDCFDKLSYNIQWAILNFSCRYHWWNYIVDGLKCLIYWLPVIWSDRDFDHAFFYKMLFFKLKKMEINAKNCKYHYDKKDIHRITVAKNLAYRIWTEDYSFWDEAPNYVVPKEGVNFSYDEYLINQDIEMLTMILKKYSRSWWN